jgi:Leucine-rich repeat (LRR) protein
MAKKALLWPAAAAVCAVVAVLVFSCSGDGGGVDVDDETFPSSVKDLRVKSVTPTTVTLEWTAPGDDDTVGTAALYDLRYKTGNLSWENWDDAIPVSGEPAPSPSGSPDSMVVTGLIEDSTYYFGIKTKNHAGIWSWLSNIPMAVCFDDFVVTFPDQRLDEIMRTKIAIPTGPIHRSDLLPVAQLFANNQSIADISGLEYCINLDAILMWNNQASNLSPLANLTRMRVLQIGHNQIADIGPLAGLVNLEQLHLHENLLISDITALTAMTKLSDVHLGGNDISDIGALSGKTAMRILVLDRNRISDIAALTGMTEMIGLSITENQVTSIAALAGMTKLESLNLWKNQVGDISPLASSTNLLTLSLWENNVSDISALAGMTKLEELYLIRNQIANAGALENLTALRKLYLSDNPALADISALAGLTALDDLQIQNCAIVDVTALQGLPNLQKLVLNNNQIADVAPLAANAGLGPGDLLYLSGNPLSKESIDVHIPALQARGVTVVY